MLRVTCVLSALLLSGCVSAVSVESIFATRTDETTLHLASGSMALGPDDSVYSSGWSHGTIHGVPKVSHPSYHDGFILKQTYNSSADPAELQFNWVHRMGSTSGSRHFFRGVDTDPEGGAYACGWTNGHVETPLQGNYDVVVSAVNNDGSRKWQIQLNSAEYEPEYSFGSCPMVYKGGYIHFWFRDSTNQIQVIKMRASNGEIIWRQQFGATSAMFTWEWAHGGNGAMLAVDESMNLYFVAQTTGNLLATQGSPAMNAPSTHNHLVTFKVDASGRLIWRNFLAPQYHVYPSALSLDGAGRVIISGLIQGPLDDQAHEYGSDPFLYEVDRITGERQWSRIMSPHQGNGEDYFVAMTTTPDGRIFAADTRSGSDTTFWMNELGARGHLVQDIPMSSGYRLWPFQIVHDAAKNRVWALCTARGTLGTFVYSNSYDYQAIILFSDDRVQSNGNCSEWQSTLTDIEAIIGVDLSS